MSWTPDQVIALAPDPASAKAGRGLAGATKWVFTGFDERSVWGELQGSGASPYQTSIDLDEPAFKCSCPSRKFPCKHAIGLFLLYVQGVCEKGSRPAWTDEWLSKRDAKQAAPTPKPARDTSSEAVERSAAKREERVASGLRDCETWLKDTMRQGLASPALQTPRYWEGFAAQLVDAQAPGAARMVREIGELVSSGSGWQERVLERLGLLYLLVKAFENVERLPEEVRWDVRSLLGWTWKKEELPVELHAQDHWCVVGQKAYTQERLSVQRSWLRGLRTQRWGMVLAFSIAGQPFDPLLVPGSAFEGTLAFYPGSSGRAALLDRTNAPFEYSFDGEMELGLDAFSLALATNPWIEAFPLSLGKVKVLFDGDRWGVEDAERKLLPVHRSFQAGWHLLAASGGGDIDMFGEWDGRAFLPLAAQSEGRYLRL